MRACGAALGLRWRGQTDGADRWGWRMARDETAGDETASGDETAGDETAGHKTVKETVKTKLDSDNTDSDVEKLY